MWRGLVRFSGQKDQPLLPIGADIEETTSDQRKKLRHAAAKRINLYAPVNIG
jgi:hypothetical protein